MKEVVLDTETTGLSVEDGHRIIEIAACEMKDYVLTGEIFHKYINPERDIDIGASKIHGIKIEDLKNQPKFNEIIFQQATGKDSTSHAAMKLQNHQYDEYEKIRCLNIKSAL